MALLLRLRTRVKSKAFTNPSMLHRFSTSKYGDDEPEASVESATSDNQSPTPSNSTSPFASYFSDVKNSLKQRQPTASPPRKPQPFSFTASDSSPPRPSKAPSLEDIHKKLSEFSRRNAARPPGDTTARDVTFQEILKRNVLGKSGESTGNANLGPGKAGGKFSSDAIRESLRQLGLSKGALGDRKGVDPMSLPAFKDSLNLKPSDSAGSVTSSTVIGRMGALPASIFGKEMRENKEGERLMAKNTTMYSYAVLGEKLRALRPEGKGKDWFSLGELNERLMNLEEMAKHESVNKGFTYEELKDVVRQMKDSSATEKKISMHKLNILGRWDKTPAYMLEPPQEHLVEKYFHPDNMSSAEKLKIELTKVRDEFKMSESDCGSARVQVAQLTTKIKHLSSVLHKKDVHSRKGLLAMVQRRKRLLKYLRRTDWDSYCFVISKLGLRDNPDITSGGARPSKSTQKKSKKKILS